MNNCLISDKLDVKKEFNDSPYVDIPAELKKKFTINNSIPVFSWWLDGSKNEHIKWTDEFISKYLERYTPENIRSNNEWPKDEMRTDYGNNSCLDILNALQESNIVNQNVAVIGSLTPWIESMLIHMGNTVTTIEYNVPESNHEKVKCRDYFKYFTSTSDKFDTIVSFSSIEHSGLGRYGDPLDPDGDLKTMYQIHRTLKPDGLLIWGGPVGKDALTWNAHRVYGPIRFTLLTQNFREINWYGATKKELFNRPLSNNSYQPVVILKKIPTNIWLGSDGKQINN